LNHLKASKGKLGVNKNDKIAIISSTNRTEWNIMDIGIQVNKVLKNTKLKGVYSFDHIKGCKHYSELLELRIAHYGIR